MMEVLANAIVVIILPDTSVSNQHTAHLKLIQCSVNYVFEELEGKKDGQHSEVWGTVISGTL